VTFSEILVGVKKLKNAGITLVIKKFNITGKHKQKQLNKEL